MISSTCELELSAFFLFLFCSRGRDCSGKIPKVNKKVNKQVCLPKDCGNSFYCEFYCKEFSSFADRSILSSVHLIHYAVDP